MNRHPTKPRRVLSDQITSVLYPFLWSWGGVGATALGVNAGGWLAVFAVLGIPATGLGVFGMFVRSVDGELIHRIAFGPSLALIGGGFAWTAYPESPSSPYWSDDLFLSGIGAAVALFGLFVVFVALVQLANRMVAYGSEDTE